MEKPTKPLESVFKSKAPNELIVKVTKICFGNNNGHVYELTKNNDFKINHQNTVSRNDIYKMNNDPLSGDINSFSNPHLTIETYELYCQHYHNGNICNHPASYLVYQYDGKYHPSCPEHMNDFNKRPSADYIKNISNIDKCFACNLHSGSILSIKSQIFLCKSCYAERDDKVLEVTENKEKHNTTKQFIMMLFMYMLLGVILGIVIGVSFS